MRKWWKYLLGWALVKIAPYFERRVRCRVCNRPLIGVKSRMAGVGPGCARREDGQLALERQGQQRLLK